MQRTGTPVLQDGEHVSGDEMVARVRARLAEKYGAAV